MNLKIKGGKNMAIKNPRFDKLFRIEKIEEAEDYFDKAMSNEIEKT